MATILASTPGPTSIAVNTNPKLPYDPVADFAPISMLAIGANVVVVHPASPRALHAGAPRARARPPARSTSARAALPPRSTSPPSFSSPMAKVDFAHIAYKGTGLALADLLAQRLDFMIADPSILTHVKSGKLRARRHHSEALCRRAKSPPSPNPACPASKP